MNTPAKAAYLSALIQESQKREKGYETHLADSDTPHDKVSATARLESEQHRQQELRTELAALPA